MKYLQFYKKHQLSLILQDEMAECGHACVVMISNFWGHDLNLIALRKMNQPSAQGITLSQINNLLIHLGFKTRALRVPLQEIHCIKTPAIIHWNMNHFVVLKHIKRNKIIIHDPAHGVRICTQAQFEQSFTGIVLEIEKNIYFQPIRMAQKFTLYQIFKSITGLHKLFGLLLLLSLIMEFFTLLNPLFMQYVTDHVIESNNLQNLYTITGGFLFCILLQTIVEYTRERLVLYSTTNLAESFASNVFNHLLQLPLSFFETRHQGDIQSKFQAIEQIKTKISSDFINTLLDGVMFFLNLSVMCMYSNLLTGIVLGALVFYISLRYSSYRALKRETASSLHFHAKTASIFLESLRAITPIKSFLKENRRFTTWRNSYIDSVNADIQITKKEILYRVSNQLIFNMEHIIVICVGVHLVLKNQFSIGMLIAFLAYRLMLVNKSSSFIRNLFEYQLISVQLNRLSDIIFQEPEVQRMQQICEPTVKGNLSIEAVSFRYNPHDRDILSNVTLNIQPGEKVVLIGPSGCGKSTLLKIMLGLLPPTTGNIFIDNIPLDLFGLKNYRNLTASVMQDDALLSGSILENITFFEDEVDIARVHQVAKLAAIDEKIATLPMKYDTLIGDMGSTLSGGQKQRLLLARALYKQPKFLFLDEATSHLDCENEKTINDALQSLSITQIIVAHRQETIRMADRVIDLSVFSNNKYH